MRPSSLVACPDDHQALQLDAAVLATQDDWDRARTAAEGDGRGDVEGRVRRAWGDWLAGTISGGDDWQARAAAKSRAARAARGG